MEEKVSKKTTPCWEEAWSYVDLSEVNESDAATEHFFDQYTNYSFTKLVGMAHIFNPHPIINQANSCYKSPPEEKTSVYDW
ncbi:hypothetical protein ACEQPO_06800 [Bacillus sp. SL00103]